LGHEEAALDAPFDGADLAPLWSDGSEPFVLVGYSESTSLMAYNTPFPKDEQDVKNDQLYAITYQQWKYIHHRFGLAPDELYDLDADPGETTNLVEEQPDLAREMKARLLSMGVYPKNSENLGGMSPEDVERLRSLGYIGTEGDR
jgi:arylsulfatase A-like enzyme